MDLFLDYTEKQNHEVLNIAFGDRTSLNKLWNVIVKYLNCDSLIPNYYEERVGDVKHSLADISKAKKIIKWEPTISFKQMVKEMVIEDIKNIK